MPRPIFTALDEVEKRLWKITSRSEKRTLLAPELRAQLVREFAPEVERLSELLGRDLTHWNRSLPVENRALTLAPREAPLSSSPALACCARAE
jgi:hypothetical protein